jgi:hypothetical protein
MSQTALAAFCLLTDVIVVAVLLGGLWTSLKRSNLTPGAQARAGSLVTCLLIAWNALSFLLAWNGIFVARRFAFHAPNSAFARAMRTVFSVFPPIVFAVALPVAIGLSLTLRSKAMAKIVDATPLSWLVGVQFYRVAGAIFLILCAAGQLPWQFAFPAGGGDVLVGVLAIPVAWAASRDLKASGMAAYAWNVLGILDLVVALTMGFLTSPSPFQMIALDHPNLLVSRFPLVMIPAFMVPLSLILHGICLWKLGRMTRSFT